MVSPHILWIFAFIIRTDHKDSDGKTKNDHFQDMLRESAARGLNPDCVLFDSWSMNAAAAASPNTPQTRQRGEQPRTPSWMGDHQDTEYTNRTKRQTRKKYPRQPHKGYHSNHHYPCFSFRRLCSFLFRKEK